MKGYIHSVESFGTVDGPGIRFVIFLQGCPMRCKYCHNPDTWEMKKGREVSADELIEEYMKNIAFYSHGGITVTGGEALLQVDFLLELFKKAKENNIHTCIDTSGITYTEGETSYNKKLDKLMKYTDLVMLDIKHIDPEMHKELTGKKNEGILAFAKYLEKKNIPLSVRHVVVSGITDKADDLKRLGRFIGTLRNLEYIDVLPYHTMGKVKYEKLGIAYPLEGVPETTHEQVFEAKKHIIEGIMEVRQEK